jgi:hypothetical protein
MSDRQGETPESTQTRLSRSVGTVWQNYNGERPGTVSAEIKGDVVRCSIEEANGDWPNSTGDHNDAILAVSRVMERKVKAFIPGHDKKSGATTGTFILEPPRVAR